MTEANGEPEQIPGVQYDGLTGQARGGIERGSFETIQRDKANVRAIRDSKKVCVRCTFCGRCKRAERRRPVHEHLLDSL